MGDALGRPSRAINGSCSCVKAVGTAQGSRRCQRASWVAAAVVGCGGKSVNSSKFRWSIGLMWQKIIIFAGLFLNL